MAARPAAEQILERYVQACGGRQAFDSIRVEVQRGSVEILGLPEAGSLEFYWSAPRLVYHRMELPLIGAIEQGVRDTVCWKRSPGQPPQLVLEGEERRDMLAEAAPFPEIHWKERFRALRAVGVDTLGSRPADRVEMTDLFGVVFYEDFDRESGLLVRRTTQTSSAGIPGAVITIEDYRLVHGVRVPFKSTENVGERSIVTRMDSIEFNIAVPPDRFDLPAEIRALLER